VFCGSDYRLERSVWKQTRVGKTSASLLAF
jgi:hypothetical protein